MALPDGSACGSGQLRSKELVHGGNMCGLCELLRFPPSSGLLAAEACVGAFILVPQAGVLYGLVLPDQLHHMWWSFLRVVQSPASGLPVTCLFVCCFGYPPVG